MRESVVLAVKGYGVCACVCVCVHVYLYKHYDKKPIVIQ